MRRTLALLLRRRQPPPIAALINCYFVYFRNRAQLIRIPSNETAYSALRTLFAADLEMQGIGTYADICNDKRDALLPVPYWASCTPKKPKLLTQHASPMPKKINLSIDEESLILIRQYC
jgi:hypothetical protein